MKNRVDAPVNRSSNVVGEQIDQLQKEVRNIRDKVRELELELEGWQRSCRLSTTTFQHLRESKAKIEEDMKEGQRLLSPISRVPSEVWVDIFRWSVQLEMEEYALDDSKTPLRSCAFILSQVCCDWRNMVLQERNLWDIITIHPYKYWSQGKYHLFTTSLSRSSTQVSLVVNPSQILGWVLKHADGYQYTYTNNHGHILDAIQPNEGSEMSEKSYNVHIVIKDDYHTIYKRLEDIPFWRPSSLELTILSPYMKGLFGWIYMFSSITSLTFNQECPAVKPWGFSATFSNLNTLKFHVKYFTVGFPIETFLTPTLKELHLHHHQSKYKLPPLSDTVWLPNLEILGISLLSSDFLHNILAPDLSTLLFYGTSVGSTMVPQAAISTIPDSLLKQLIHLQFEECGILSGAVSCLQLISTKLSCLRRLTFSNSYVQGHMLISTIEASSTPTGDQLTLSSLDSIILNHTRGITQIDCEILRSMGKTVTVHV